MKGIIKGICTCSLLKTWIETKSIQGTRAENKQTDSEYHSQSQLLNTLWYYKSRIYLIMYQRFTECLQHTRHYASCCKYRGKQMRSLLLWKCASVNVSPVWDVSWPSSSCTMCSAVIKGPLPRGSLGWVSCSLSCLYTRFFLAYHARWWASCSEVGKVWTFVLLNIWPTTTSSGDWQRFMEAPMLTNWGIFVIIVVVVFSFKQANYWTGP